ncbi:MAG: hypothetical protein JPMHGGIA_01574 [Saprospiraceae bacterium]|nr:hypothetical protein [Saprospiraceae bacterium]
MNLVDNALLALASIMWMGMLLILFGKQENVPGADALAGAVWSMVHLFLGFLLFMGAFVAWVYFRGGFNWVTPPAGPRWAWVIAGYALVIFASAMAALYKLSGSAGTAMSGRIVEIAAWLLPALALFGGLLMVNGYWLGTSLESFGRLLLRVAFWSSLAGSGIAFTTWVRDSVTAAKTELEAIGERDAARQQGEFTWIDCLDQGLQFPSRQQFTNCRMDPPVRERPMARSHAIAEWLNAPADALAGDAAPETSVFPATNDVPNEQTFVSLIFKGLHRKAEPIAKPLDGMSNPAVQSSKSFGRETERILWTPDRQGASATIHGESLRRGLVGFRAHGTGRPCDAVERIDQRLVGL